MFNDKEEMKRWLGRARDIYDKRMMYEEAFLTLHGACGSNRVRQECDRLTLQESLAHQEAEKYLNTSDLSPRQGSEK